jgi:hypothetical protein
VPILIILLNNEAIMSDKKITWNTVKRYFRGIDIAIMRDEVERTQILDNYDRVVSSADTIADLVYSQQPGERMPPPPYAPWPAEQIENFESWADPNTPLKVDTDLQLLMAPFVKLSQLLTGFSGLNNDPDLAQKYLERLRQNNHWANGVKALLDTYSSYDHDTKFVNQILQGPNPEYKEVAKVIILLWYTGAFFDPYGFPSDFGTKEDNQYIDGLVWQTISAHPMAYSTEGKQYWAKEPTSDGRFSGLGNTAQRPIPPVQQ